MSRHVGNVCLQSLTCYEEDTAIYLRLFLSWKPYCGYFNVDEMLVASNPTCYVCHHIGEPPQKLSGSLRASFGLTSSLRVDGASSAAQPAVAVSMLQYCAPARRR